jgi:hypothetical protein
MKVTWSNVGRFPDGKATSPHPPFPARRLSRLGAHRGREGCAPLPLCYCRSSGSSVYGSRLPDFASPREMK